jgi:hypothetical protein
MKVSLRWLLLVAFGAGVLGYLLGGGEDQPGEDTGTIARTEELPRAAGVPGRQGALSGRDRYVPRDRDADISGAFPEATDWAAPPPRPGGYSFRPETPSPQVREGYPAEPPPAWQDDTGYSYEPPGVAERRAPRPDSVRRPPAADYRFRPLEQGEQSRRWRQDYQRMSAPPVPLARPVRAGMIAGRLD